MPATESRKASAGLHACGMDTLQGELNHLQGEMNLQGEMTPLLNWSGNCVKHGMVFTPSTQNALCKLVQQYHPDVAVVGTCHSQSLPDVGVYIRSTSLRRIVDFEPRSHAVTVEAGATLAHMLQFLHAKGWTTHAIPGILDQTVVGAVINDTHGIGFTHTQLCDQVIGLKMVSKTKPHTIVMYTAHPDTLYNAIANNWILEVTMRIEPYMRVEVMIESFPLKCYRTLLEQPTPARMITIMPNVRRCFVSSHEKCHTNESSMLEQFGNVCYRCFKSYVGEIFYYCNSSWSPVRLAVETFSAYLPVLRVTSSNSDIISSPRYMSGVGDVEFAIPIQHAPAAFDELLRAALLPGVFVYNIRFGISNEIKGSMVFQQDVVYISVQFLYSEYDSILLDIFCARMISMFDARLHQGKYVPKQTSASA
jgi:hypothetical protein